MQYGWAVTVSYSRGWQVELQRAGSSCRFTEVQSENIVISTGSSEQTPYLKAAASEGEGASRQYPGPSVVKGAL